MSIQSEDNRKLLVQLLSSHPLKSADPAGFDSILDSQLERLHNNRFRYRSDLMLMNKEILRIFQEMAYTMRPTSQNRKLPVKEEPPPPKIQIFETRLKEKQDNFNKMIKAVVPEEIDFTDKTKDPPLVSNAIDLTMLQREKELKKIMSSYENGKGAEAWIKGDDNIKPSNLNIKIDRKTDVQIDAVPVAQATVINTKILPPVEPKRRVTFMTDNKPPTGLSIMNTQDLFRKLKLKNSDDDVTENKALLREIVSNQDRILKELVALNGLLRSERGQAVA